MDILLWNVSISLKQNFLAESCSIWEFLASSAKRLNLLPHAKKFYAFPNPFKLIFLLFFLETLHFYSIRTIYFSTFITAEGVKWKKEDPENKLTGIQEEHPARVNLGDWLGKGLLKIQNLYVAGNSRALAPKQSWIPSQMILPFTASAITLVFGCRRALQLWPVTYTVTDRFNNLLAWLNGERLLRERLSAESSVICTFSNCLCLKPDTEWHSPRACRPGNGRAGWRPRGLCLRLHLDTSVLEWWGRAEQLAVLLAESRGRCSRTAG